MSVNTHFHLIRDNVQKEISDTDKIEIDFL